MRRRLASLALAFAAAGCRSADPSLFPPRPDLPAAQVTVLDNHWHTALILRYDELPEPFRQDLRRFADCRYVMIGWGDEGFFRAEKVTVGLALRALFASRGSVLLVVGFDVEPDELFAPGVDLYRVPASRAGLDRMIAFVAKTFTRRNEDVVDLGPGIDGGEFFAAEGRYAFFHTCNNWTADALAAGGLPVTPLYAQTAGNVAFQVRQMRDVTKNGRAVPEAKRPDAFVLRLARGGRP